MTALAERAQEYRDLGLSVFPVGRDKHPLIEWKPYQTELPHPDQIAVWWDESPSANVGMATGAVSGCIVLDADGPRGLASLKALGTPATTWLSRTGRPEGGWHQFFQHPGGHIGNRAGLKPGLDVRGDGGYVILPPSVHASGRVYEWRSSPQDLPLAPLPDPVLKLLMTPPAPNGHDASDSMVSEGRRNEHLYRLARSLLARGLGSAALHAALLEENRTRCQPPLSELEVRGIATHAATQPHRSDFAPVPMSTAPTDRPLIISAAQFLQRPRRVQPRLIPGLGGLRGGKLGIYGPGGSGKSYGFLNIGMAGALGRPLFGHPAWAVSAPLRVGFASLEDSAPLQVERVGRLLPHFEVATPPEHLYIFDRDLEPSGLTLAGARGVLNARAFARLDECLGDLRLDLLLLEPKVYLAETEENSNSENSPWLRRLGELLVRHGTLAILGHHAGWDREGKIHARGGSAFRDWVDGMIQQVEDQIQGKPGFLLTCDKMNFAPRWSPLSVLFDPETGSMTAEGETAAKLPRALLTACFSEHGGAIAGPVEEVYAVVGKHASVSEATARRACEAAVKDGWLLKPGRGKGLQLAPLGEHE